jgi:hypothetical protein
MNRRQALPIFTLGAAGLFAAPRVPAADTQAPSVLPGTYEEFGTWLEAARTASLAYLKANGTTDTERFMKLLSLWACAMPEPPEPRWQRVAGGNALIEMATVAPGRPFVVSAFRMAPGAILPLHCHPGGGGITICMSGSMAIQHFQLSEMQPRYSETGAVAEVRQVLTAQLDDRQSTQFTPTQSNLHQFHAGQKGIVGVELAVQWQGSGEFSFLKLERPAAVDGFAAGRPLRGRWVGMQLADAYS